IPGKIFEYLATGKPILSFGPQDSDVKRILSETHAGKHFSYQDAASLKEFILNQYQNWKSGSSSSHIKNIEKFSRKNLTEKLSQILDK
ncbi:MAG TPA: glycosyl transferase family 1, partial [Chryseobacterium sp.]|nr:glycosyl transferase family 1 [Chryseobacterium sp.]